MLSFIYIFIYYFILFFQRKNSVKENLECFGIFIFLVMVSSNKIIIQHSSCNSRSLFCMSLYMYIYIYIYIFFQWKWYLVFFFFLKILKYFGMLFFEMESSKINLIFTRDVQKLPLYYILYYTILWSIVNHG